MKKQHCIPTLLQKAGLLFFTLGFVLFLANSQGLMAQTNTFPSSGYVGIGTTTPAFAIQLIGTDWNTSQISLYTAAGTPTPGGSNNYTPQFRFEKSRGTQALPVKVEDGDRIGAFLAGGHDGSKIQRSAVFGFRVDGATSVDTMPVAFFVQTGDASTNKPERMIITSDGKMGLGDSKPDVELHVAPNFDVLFGDSIAAAGNKLFWVSGIGAFRAGSVTGNRWDPANIAPYSFASGRNTLANGQYSTALGYETDATNSNATAMGYMTVASGITSTAMGSATSATNFHATSIGEGTQATGYTSTAMGSGTVASGDYATSSGGNTLASGNESFSMGNNTTAQAYASLVIGRDNIISGTPNAWIPTEPLFVAGNGNTTGTPSNAMELLKNGDVFFGGVITGDGSGLTNIPGDGDWLTAPGMVYNLTDMIGIGRTPTIPLHVAPSLDVLFGQSLMGAGTRMMWLAQSGALRAGTVSGTQWDDPPNVGTNSFANGLDNVAVGPNAAALGENNQAVGTNSFASGYTTLSGGPMSASFGNTTAAMGPHSVSTGLNTAAMGMQSATFGEGTQAIGPNSLAGGFNSIASGAHATALGLSTQATNLASTSLGDNTIASGPFATSMGDLTRAQGAASTSMGFQTVASGTNATAMGDSTQASGWNATSMGYFTRAIGDHATVMGVKDTLLAPFPTVAQSYAQLTIGDGNWISGIENPVQWFPEDPIFQIGIAPSPLFCLPGQTDAVHVTKAGQVGLGMSPLVSMFPMAFQLELSTPLAAMPGGGPWLASSDRRLKQDIRPFDEGLEVIRQVNPVRFRYNERSGYSPDNEYVGVVAQDMRDIAPYMVIESKTESRDGNKYLAYDGKAMDYLLVNAVKELDTELRYKDAEIDALRDDMEALRDENEFMSIRMEALEALMLTISSDVQSCCYSGDLLDPIPHSDQPVLGQNVPNPYDDQTRIRFYLPDNVTNAFIQLSDLKGAVQESYPIATHGHGEIIIDGGKLAEGTYLYTLVIDGLTFESKRMILTK